MPNGYDRNWVRLLIILGRFRAKYGSWPSKILLSKSMLDNLKNDLFTLEAFAKLEEKLEFIVNDDGFGAEDNSGNFISYNESPDSGDKQNINPYEWLGVSPDRPHEQEW